MGKPEECLIASCAGSEPTLDPHVKDANVGTISNELGFLAADAKAGSSQDQHIHPPPLPPHLRR